MIAANAERKLTIKDSEKFLGSNTYVKSIHSKEAINMLTSVENVAMALAGGKP